MLPRSSHHCWLPPVQAAARKWPQPGPGCMGEHLSCTAGPELRAGTWGGCSPSGVPRHKD